MRRTSRGTSPTSTTAVTIHASSRTSSRRRQRLPPSASSTTARVADLSPAELREAIEERERIESTFTRAIYYAHLWFATDMNDSQRGALVARLTEKGAAIDTQLLFFGLELAALEDEQADALLASEELEHWRHWLRTVRKFRPYVLTEPEEKILTEKSVSGFSAWDRLYDELLGAIKVDLDGTEIGFEEAMAKLYSADRDERRRASEAVTVSLGPGCARAPSSSTRSPSTSRSTTGCAGTRPGSARATSRTTRPTRPCRRSSTRSSGATTSSSATTPSRRSCSASTASRSTTAWRPSPRTRRRSPGGRRGSSCSTPSPTSRPRPVTSSSGSSRRAGSTHRRVTASGRAPSAPPTCRACTRTSS